jgi:hypothetical protein
MNGTTAVICGQRRSSNLLRLVLTVFTVHFRFLPFLHMAFAIPVLQAVFAYILEPGAITTLFALR